jgi:hypothetical protein
MTTQAIPIKGTQAVGAAAQAGQSQANAGEKRRGMVGQVAGLVWAQVKKPLVLAGMFSVGYLAIGFQYYNTVTQEGHTDTIIEARRAVLSRPAPDSLKASYEAIAWGAARDAAISVRVPTLPHSELVARTLATADEFGVTVFTEGALPSAPAFLNGTDYIVTPLNIKAIGQFEDLQKFLARLERGTLETLEVKNATLSKDQDGYVMTLLALVYSEPELTPAALADGAEAEPEAAAAP